MTKSPFGQVPKAYFGYQQRAPSWRFSLSPYRAAACRRMRELVVIFSNGCFPPRADRSGRVLLSGRNG